MIETTRDPEKRILPNHIPNGPFMVADWRVDPSVNLLVRGEERVSLEPKVMDLLVLLASSPGRTFSRSDLDEALWPNVTVGEDTLARTVSKLRSGLGDAANSPTFVETIPKRGYRLIAPVSEDEPALKPRLSKAIFAAGMAFALVLGGAVLWSVAGLRADDRSGDLQTVSTNEPEQVSPGGSLENSLARRTTDRANDLYMRFTRADNEAAIALYERAIATDPDFVAAHAGLANALVQRAVRWQTQPGAAPSATSLREALANGNMEGAEATALLGRAIDLGGRAVRLDPENADALKALGFAHSAKGQLATAERLYGQAVALDPDAWEVMINLGEIASIEDDPEAALEWYVRAFAAMDRLYSEEPQRIGPWRAPLGVTIGARYAEAGDAAAAEAWYRRVLDQSPLHGDATRRLALLLGQRGDLVEAQRLCAEFKARVDSDADCPGDVALDGHDKAQAP
ncbi:MAG: winged helix-turn-helix domain-containing protein [Pseudomonadota bacterium]